MVASSEAVSGALKDDKLINESELETRVEKIPKKILDETVNVSRVKKHFTTDAWKNSTVTAEESQERKDMGL